MTSGPCSRSRRANGAASGRYSAGTLRLCRTKLQTSPGGALEGYAYTELDGNIRIAVPADWAAGEVGTVALEWAPQGGSQRLVAYVEASYDSAPPPFGTVNFVKFEVQTGNGP